MSTKVKPNAACPCGSGKKYKKCCRVKNMREQAKVATPAPLTPADVLANAVASGEPETTKGGKGIKNKASSTKSGGKGSGAHGASVRSHTSAGNSSR